MENITKELSSVLLSSKERTNKIDQKKISKKNNQEILIQVIEEFLSMVYCKYSLDLTESIVFNRSSNAEIHLSLSRTLSLLQKTKKEIGKYVETFKKDPISDEYLNNTLKSLGYTVINS